MSPIHVVDDGLVDEGIYGYTVQSDYAYLKFGHDDNNNIFYFYMIRTPKEEDKNKGYAKEVLEYFFERIVKEYNGRLDVGAYTTSGESHIKHVMERLARQYNVRLI